MPHLKRHTIQQAKPYRYLLIIIITALISFFSLSFFMQENHSQQQGKLIKAHQEIKEVIQQIEVLSQKVSNQNSIIEQLKTKNKHIEEQKNQLKTNIIEQSSEEAIQLATTKQLQLQLTDLQQQINSLNKDLLFYQSITQGNSSSKLQIRELHLRADPLQPELVRYRLVITQGKKINSAITGTIKISLNTDDNGAKKQHAIAQHKLNLRHVQVLEGKINMVDKINPLTIKIELIRKKQKKLSRTFDWQLSKNTN